MKTQENEVDVNDLFKITANRIIKWHNEVPDMPENERIPSLQALTHLLIQDIGERLGNKIGVPINLGISMSPEMRKHVDEIKRKEGFATGNEKLKKMFDDENDGFLY